MTIIKILLVCCLALSSIQSSWASYPQCLVDCTLCNQSQVGEQLNGTIIAYPGRESLDLTGKELQYLPDETWNNPALESLILDYNQLVEFDPDLGYFWNLKYLSMVGNKISKSIPPEIGALWQLYELDLSYNFLTNLPQEIKYMHNLAVLRAGGNQLTGLPDELTLCSNLEVLQLNHNQLKALPASIGKCNKLVKVNLAQNRLSWIPDGAMGMRNLKCLKELDLEQNYFRNIPFWLNCMKELSVVKLKGNPGFNTLGKGESITL